MVLKDKYYTVSEAAEELSVTRQTVSRWIASGKLPAERIGREALIEKKELNRARVKWLFSHTLNKAIIEILVGVIRKKYGYTKEDKIEQMGDDLVFTVTKSDGNREKLKVSRHTISVKINQDTLDSEIEISVHPRKIVRTKYEESGKEKGVKK